MLHFVHRPRQQDHRLRQKAGVKARTEGATVRNKVMKGLSRIARDIQHSTSTWRIITLRKGNNWTYTMNNGCNAVVIKRSLIKIFFYLKIKFC